MNDLKQFISQKNSNLLQKHFGSYAKQEVDDFIKEKIEELDFAMTLMEMKKEHFGYGGNSKYFNKHHQKMQIIILKNDSKDLILGNNNEKLYSIFEWGDPPTRVHPSCHLYLLSYYCSLNASYTNMFNNYMHLAVEDRKSANPFVGYVLNDEWNPYYYEKESGPAVQPPKKDVEKVRSDSEEGTLIKFTVEKATEITKNDVKTIQDQKDVQMEVPNEATEKNLKEIVLNIEKEYLFVIQPENYYQSLHWFLHYLWKWVILIHWFHM